MNGELSTEFDGSDQASRIIIVDDEVQTMEALCITLHHNGYDTVGFSSSRDALDAIRKQKFDLLLTDLIMPEMDGVNLLNAALKLDPDLIGIMMTGHGTITTAISAMKAGATDYILKPFNLSVILPVLERSLSLRRLRLEKAELERMVHKRSRDLEESNRELEAFSYSVAHDLRTPLRSIHGFTQILIEDHHCELNPVGKEQLTRISKAAQRMDEIIEILLSLARLSQCRPIISRVNLSDLAQRSAALLQGEHPGRSVEVVIAPKLHADCDELYASSAWRSTIFSAMPGRYSANQPEQNRDGLPIRWRHSHLFRAG